MVVELVIVWLQVQIRVLLWMWFTVEWNSWHLSMKLKWLKINCKEDVTKLWLWILAITSCVFLILTLDMFYSRWNKTYDVSKMLFGTIVMFFEGWDFSTNFMYKSWWFYKKTQLMIWTLILSNLSLIPYHHGFKNWKPCSF